MVSSGNTIVSPEMTLDWVVGENIIEPEVLFNLQHQKEITATDITNLSGVNTGVDFK